MTILNRDIDNIIGGGSGKKRKSKNKKSVADKSNKNDQELVAEYAPTTSMEKRKLIIDEFMRRNTVRTSGTKLNYSTTEQTINALKKKPSRDALLNAIMNHEKYENIGSTITLGEGQKSIRLKFFSGANFYDVSNPQRGLLDGSWKLELLEFLRREEPTEKKVLFIAGNILGDEWTFNHLLNAEYDETHKCYKYFGLNDRANALLNLLNFVAKYNVEVHLINGFQEHTIIKKSPTNRDIFQEVVNKVNKSNVMYHNKSTNVLFNILSGKNVMQLRVATNMNSKSDAIQSDIMAAARSNGNLDADLTVVTNSNSAARMGNHLLLPSGQSTYKRTSKGKYAPLAPKDYDEFLLTITGQHQFEFVEGGKYLYRGNIDAQMKLVREQYKKQYLSQKISEKVSETILQFEVK